MSHTLESVRLHIIDYLRTRFGGSLEVNEHSRLIQDLSIDSLQVFEIMEDLEETYQIVVPLEVLYKPHLQTVSELAQEVLHLLEQKG
jgi:acyl carrier protein